MHFHILAAALVASASAASTTKSGSLTTTKTYQNATSASITAAPTASQCERNTCYNFFKAIVGGQPSFCPYWENDQHEDLAPYLSAACTASDDAGVSSRISSACECFGYTATATATSESTSLAGATRSSKAKSSVSSTHSLNSTRSAPTISLVLPSVSIKSTSTTLKTSTKPSSSASAVKSSSSSISASNTPTSTSSTVSYPTTAVVCPAANGTIHREPNTNRDYMILCDTEINTGYHNTPAISFEGSLDSCMVDCTNYAQTSGGFACGAVSFVNGGLCYFYDRLHPTYSASGDSTAVLVVS